MRRSRSQQARRRSIFSAQELRQLAYTNETLRNLNRSALSRLKHVRDSYLNTKQYREAAESFEILAIRINSVLQFRDKLTTGGRAQKPAVAHVTIGTVCPNCLDPLEKHRTRAKDQDRWARVVGWQVWAVRQTPPRR